MTQSDISQRIASLPPEKQKRLLERLKQQKQGSETIPQQSREARNAFPLSFSQQRLWFLHQLERNNAFYNIPGAVQIDGELDVKLLKQCFETIIHRHEILRTHFELQGGEPRQVINPPSELTIPITDLQSQPQAEVEKQIQAEASQPFDLSQAPLMRISLLRLHPQRHILLFILHHIVSDAWSRGVMLQEFTTLYNSLRQQETPQLPALPIQYADFAVWQRQQESKYQEQLNYWQQKLSPLPPVLDLPFDYSRPEVQTFRGGQIKFSLSSELTQQLQSLSQQENATLFMTLLAGWQTLLSRYTGQTDITIGSPITKRDRAEIENLIGFFSNTLVLRTDLGGNSSFREILQRVRETALSAYSHQDIPFEKVVEALQPDRDLARTPLFQVMFAFHNLPVLPQLPDLDLTLLDADSGTAKFDLSLLMRWDETEGLLGMLEYNSDLLTRETVTRMATHFQTLLQALVTHPDQAITGFSFLTPEEEQQFTHWNETTVNYPQSCVHTLVEEQVTKTPNEIALIAGEDSFTYQTLDQQANQLANYLQQQGIKAEDRIGISLERNFFLPLAILAVLKLGGTYIPLDPSYPQQRLAFMVKDSQLKVILTQSDLRDIFPTKTAILELDTAWETIKEASVATPETTIRPEALAYIIYTSGSTGQPKGVMMPHRALNNLIRWQRDQSPQGLKTLQFASFSFDVSFQECFATWSSGGTLVMVSASQKRDPDQLLNIIKEQAIERLFLPFVAISQLAEASQRQGIIPHSLQEVITAGEQLQITPAIQSLFQQLPHCRLINQYGPSETHVVTAYPLPENPENWSSLPPIGRPIANVQTYVLDDNQNPLPVGVTGELYIGGTALAKGYLNRDDLTAERFVSSLYKTGDLVRYLPDGNLQYLGRKDNQVKVRGFRIELGEIEAILAQHPAVRETAVTVKFDESEISRLVAYLVTDSEITREELQQFLGQSLPSYSIPSQFIFLETLPLTPSGKVDRRSLPDVTIARSQLATTYTPPNSNLEQQIAKIWQDVLNLETVGIDDNFFDLGGHSLLIVQVRTQLETQLNQEISLVTLFQYPTIRSLANYLNDSNRDRSHLQATVNRAQKRAQMRSNQRQQRRHNN